MFKNIIITFFILLIFPSLASAERLKLLVLPLSDGRSYIFYANLKKECSFYAVNDVENTNLRPRKNGNWFIERVNLLQNEINLEIKTLEITDQDIFMTLNIAENLKFKFSFDKDCKLKKTIYFDDKVYSLDEIYIEYTNAFFSPVIKKFILNNNGVNTDLVLLPWALHGMISTYEFNLGPALNIHSNIRLNNQNTFEKHNPVIEPVPAFLFRYGPLFINKDGLGSLLYTYEGVSLLGVGILEGEPYKARGLYEREKGIFIGGMLNYEFLQLFYYRDFFKNKGTNLKLTLAPEFYSGPDWKFTPQVFVQYWDRKYVDYYFGVKSEESVSSGLKKFDGKPTLNFGPAFEVIHYVDKWTFVMNLSVKSYGNEVYASPTVVRQNEVRFITSVLYKIF